MKDYKDIPELEREDEVWDLLGKASQEEASPMFSRNVLRAIRIEEEEAKEANVSWWQRIFAGKRAFALAGGVAAGLAVVAAVTQLTKAPENSELVASSSPTSTAPTTSEDSSTTVIPDLGPVAINSPLMEDITAATGDDDIITDFLIAISENPEILNSEEIDSLMSF